MKMVSQGSSVTGRGLLLAQVGQGKGSRWLGPREVIYMLDFDIPYLPQVVNLIWARSPGSGP